MSSTWLVVDGVQWKGRRTGRCAKWWGPLAVWVLGWWPSWPWQASGRLKKGEQRVRVTQSGPFNFHPSRPNPQTDSLQLSTTSSRTSTIAPGLLGLHRQIVQTLCSLVQPSVTMMQAGSTTNRRLIDRIELTAQYCTQSCLHNEHAGTRAYAPGLSWSARFSRPSVGNCCSDDQGMLRALSTITPRRRTRSAQRMNEYRAGTVSLRSLHR